MRNRALRVVAGGLDWLYFICQGLAGAMLVALCALVIVSIGGRLVGLYAGGVTDLAGYAMAAATFLALAPTFRARGHIFVALVVQRLSPRWRRRAALTAHAIMAMTAVYLAAYLARLVYFAYIFDEHSEGADAILLWIPQLPVAVGAAIFAVAVVHSGVELLLRYDNKTILTLLDAPTEDTATTIASAAPSSSKTPSPP